MHPEGVDLQLLIHACTVVLCSLVSSRSLWEQAVYLPGDTGALPRVCIRRRRPTTGNANPRGGKDPYVSPDGHNICDVRFYEQLKLFGEDAPVSLVCPLSYMHADAFSCCSSHQPPH